MRHCNSCGGEVELRVPEGDSLSRHVCTRCGHIHYFNPRIITGTVAVWDDRVLMCRRAIEPRRGLWTLPAGFLEIGETAAQGAARETREEAGAEVETGALFSLINVTYIGQVYLWYLAGGGIDDRAADSVAGARLPDRASGAEGLFRGPRQTVLRLSQP